MPVYELDWRYYAVNPSSICKSCLAHKDFYENVYYLHETKPIRFVAITTVAHNFYVQRNRLHKIYSFNRRGFNINNNKINAS